jgi:putative membrane protein
MGGESVGALKAGERRKAPLHPMGATPRAQPGKPTFQDPFQAKRGGTMKFARTIAVAAFAALAATALAQGGPNDAQIAHIVVTANQVDIDAGKLAERKGHSKEVKDFGKMMVTDHSGVNKQAVALAKKLGVKPENNDTSKALKKEGADNVKMLKGLKGAAFDKAYIDHEVAYHQQVLDAIDKVLVPNAKNEELKGLIVKVRPAFVAHLESAKQIQSSLK